jgi:GrpB-like predicted nucleotidyltransferase (UPF0157 family)
MIGLKRGIVELYQYDKEWKNYYEIEKNILNNLIEKYIIDIEHVGSTSIPGCIAKPIIDIAIGIKNINNAAIIINILKNNTYEYKFDAGIPGRHFFAKGESEKRTHYLHVEHYNGVLWLNHILFRNYLLKHPEKIEEYNKLKTELSKKYKNNRNKYTEKKSYFIENIISEAKKEFDIDKL